MIFLSAFGVSRQFSQYERGTFPVIRFVALAWNKESAEQKFWAKRSTRLLRASDSRWKVRIRTDNLLVCCRDQQQVSSENFVLKDQAIILGTLFRKMEDGSSSSRVTYLDDLESERVLASSGRHLVERYWGSYVALGSDAQVNTTWTLRGPVEPPPCFTTHDHDVSIFFSHIDDCQKFGLEFTINWEYVAAYLERLHLYECAETGLNEVSILLPGECIKSRAGKSQADFYWNALDIASRDPVKTFDEAVFLTRRTVRGCVHTWAACYDGILLQLSGGIDSSIVLSALRDAPSHTRVTCLNYFYHGSNTDERVYARQAAEHASCELIERKRDADVNLGRILDLPPSTRPSSRCISNILFYEQLESFAKATASEAILSGDGGDELFCKLPPLPAVGDYVFRHGLRPGLWRVAWDAARLAELSIWAALSIGIRAGYKPQRWDASGGDPTPQQSMFNDYLAPELRRRQGNRFVHPWLKNVSAVPSGKMYQLSMICCRPLVDGFLDDPGYADVIDPLRSQPLAELCLRIPTYLTLRGGWDRSVARHAFATDVPRDVITRVSKGGREEHVKDVMYGNLEFIRSFLLDGELSRRGMLNRSGIENMLSGNPTDIRTYIGDLYECLGTEAWVNSWTRTCDSVPKSYVQQSRSLDHH